MKKLFLMMAIVMSSSLIALAQDNPAITVSGAAQNVQEQTATPAQQQATCEVHYYYKNNRLIACSGCIWKDQAENVKLKNGTVVTHKGEVATRSWTKITKLKDGECVNLKGEIIEHKKAHEQTEKL